MKEGDKEDNTSKPILKKIDYSLGDKGTDNRARYLCTPEAH
jgi:hypothetical protein